MFILTTIQDLVQIAPQDFEKDSAEAIEDNINQKYSNKAIQKIGLCICMYDLLSASEGLIGHGTGMVNVNVEFRMVVFRPFKGEIIMGKIASATPKGIKISLDFFEDIVVPPRLLFENCHFNVQEQCWVWSAEGGSELYFDNNIVVRFRVEAEHWNDQSPAAPSEAAYNSEIQKQSPYMIEASMSQSGLGPIEWW
ncbi:MAG: DNA-directed RNA polymerase III subunit rpc25 [Cirrosporium novae-zelandiae]|nr:MAG: DNA-directed RNA polymerase III subunit rpc25 [Cirrosporium novae-zelandiae]